MLLRMQTASQSLNYFGTLVYLHDEQVQTMKVVHRADHNGEFERLINLNGVAREIVRKNNVVICYMPDSKEVMVGKQQFQGNVLAQLAENDFERLQKYYAFSFENVERVAGKAAQRILIKPKDSFRYGYRLWVDNSHANLLKSDLLSEQGKVLEQAMFADITYVDVIPDTMLEPESTSDNFTWFEHDREQNDSMFIESRWIVGALPQGFEVTSRFHHLMPNAVTPAEHWIISDGLASISIYIEKIPELAALPEAFEGSSPMGATNAFGVLLKDHQITVIGEVPAETVEKLANSISLNLGADK